MNYVIFSYFCEKQHVEPKISINFNIKKKSYTTLRILSKLNRSFKKIQFLWPNIFT